MNGERERILVVDDDAAVREAMALGLREVDYQVEEVPDADTALVRLAGNGFALALVDIRMAGHDGTWLLERIRADHSDTSVVMVTAVAEVQSAVDCLRRGATDYLVKPVPADVLKLTVERALRERRMKLELEQYRQHLEEMVDGQARQIRQTAEKYQKATGAAVEAIAKMSEMRDPYTAGHQRRVAELARAIAREMGLPEEQIEGVGMGGYLHDIGMTLVPRAIRSKLGPLTDYEFKIIMIHPDAGYDILEGLEFPWPVAEAVLQHHERLDGSGYPSGLSGDQIGMEARILAVADTVEAMLSNRPYRPPAGLEKALELISENRGTLYDPQVVDACLKLFLEKEFEFK